MKMIPIAFLVCVVPLARALVAAGTDPPLANSTAELKELYSAAQEEGGRLVISFGGDEASSNDGVMQMFKESFPAINATWTVDVSKYHDSKIDRSLNMTGKAGTDIAILQTLHDFDRWKLQGHLLPYKPLGWECVPANIKDQDGTWYAISYIVFGPAVWSAAFPDLSVAPRNFPDFKQPALKGKIALTYPNDDDAVLFQFYKLVQQYGWEEVLDFVGTQDVQWVRGTASSTEVFHDGVRTVTFTSGGSPPAIWPNETGTVMWPQSGAIFKTAENPASAKLFMSFLWSAQFQSTSGKWPVRTDLPTPSDLLPLESYNKVFNPTEFHQWMLDRATVERFRFQMEQLLGTPQGQSPLTDNINANGTTKA